MIAIFIDGIGEIGDVALKDKAATIFALKIGSLQQPVISSFTAKKEYDKAFAALDTTYQDLTHARSVLVTLLAAMGSTS